MYYKAFVNMFPSALLTHDFFVLRGTHEAIRYDIVDMSRRFCKRQGIPDEVVMWDKFVSQPVHHKWFIIDPESKFNTSSVKKYRVLEISCKRFDLDMGVVHNRLRIEKLSAPISVMNILISYDPNLMINVIQASRYFGMSVVTAGLVKYLAKFFVDTENELALSLIKKGRRGILEQVLWLSISLERFLERLKFHLYNLLIVRTSSSLPNFRLSGRYGIPPALILTYRKICDDTTIEQIYKRLYMVMSFFREKVLLSSVAAILCLW